MNDFILEEMNKYEADGVDFVSIYSDNPLGPEVCCSYSREEWVVSNRSYPKTGRRYWKIIDGKKTYIDTISFKVLEGIAKVDAEAPDMEEAQEVTDV